MYSPQEKMLRTVSDFSSKSRKLQMSIYPGKVRNSDHHSQEIKGCKTLLDKTWPESQPPLQRNSSHLPFQFDLKIVEEEMM